MKGCRNGFLSFLFQSSNTKDTKSQFVDERLIYDGYLDYERLNPEEQHHYSQLYHIVSEFDSFKRLEAQLKFWPTRRGGDGTLMTDGQLQDLMRQKRDREKRMITGYLDDLPLKAVTELRFCLISFEYMVMTEWPQKEHIPCEMALHLFRLSDGGNIINESYHTFIKPIVPNSYRAAARQHSQFHHQIPFEDSAFPFNENFKEIAEIMCRLLNKTKIKDGVYPLVFCSADQYAQTHNGLAYLREKANLSSSDQMVSTLTPNICCVEDLAHVLYRKGFNSYPGNMDMYMKRSDYEFLNGCRCGFHDEKLEVKECAKSTVVQMSCHMLELLKQKNQLYNFKNLVKQSNRSSISAAELLLNKETETDTENEMINLLENERQKKIEMEQQKQMSSHELRPFLSPITKFTPVQLDASYAPSGPPPGISSASVRLTSSFQPAAFSLHSAPLTSIQPAVIRSPTAPLMTWDHSANFASPISRLNVRLPSDHSANLASPISRRLNVRLPSVPRKSEMNEGGYDGLNQRIPSPRMAFQQYDDPEAMTDPGVPGPPPLSHFFRSDSDQRIYPENTQNAPRSVASQIYESLSHELETNPISSATRTTLSSRNDRQFAVPSHRTFVSQSGGRGVLYGSETNPMPGGGTI